MKAGLPLPALPTFTIVSVDKPFRQAGAEAFPLHEKPAQMIGSTISHYKILDKLGEGGMGVVYKAQDTSLDRLVALKFLPEAVSVGPSELERFTQEAKAAAGLNHPNICTIHGIEEAEVPSSAHEPSAGKRNFIVMEYVEGQTLEERKASLSMKQALDIGIQIAQGLAAAHEKGIVHRDIKPENIMIRKDGRVQVMDFGLAKLRGASRLTQEGSTVGTAGYMSPEQVQGLETDHRSDIFSLGVLLYEMLTGQPPFKGVHETAIAYEIVNVDTPPMSSLKSEIPPELDAIVLDCLEKDPNERTQAASQVALELKSTSKQDHVHANRTLAARGSRTVTIHVWMARFVARTISAYSCRHRRADDRSRRVSLRSFRQFGIPTHQGDDYFSQGDEFPFLWTVCGPCHHFSERSPARLCVCDTGRENSTLFATARFR
jgi:serine/threonine protein kinase